VGRKLRRLATVNRNSRNLGLLPSPFRIDGSILPPGQEMRNIEGKKIPMIALPGWKEMHAVGGLHPGNYGYHHHDDDPRDRDCYHHDDLNAPRIHYFFCVFDLQ
jgi:hypothetical protein